MKLQQHLIFSSIVALILYLIFHNPITSFVFWFSAIFIDLDHLLDYFIFNPKEILKLKYFLRKKLSYFLSCKFYKKKVFVILHSIEPTLFLLIISILTKNQLLLAITVGFSFHIFSDIVGNIIMKKSVKKIQFYFLLYRFTKQFEVSKLLNPENQEKL